VAVTNPVVIEGMGELVAFEPQPFFWFLPSNWQMWLQHAHLLPFLTPFVPTKSEPCSAAVIGGLLNAHQPIPENTQIKLRVYVISREGRQDLTHEPYQQNYSRCVNVAQLHSNWDPVVQVSGQQISRLLKDNRIEGLVGIPAAKSLVDGGYKLKMRDDSDDWKITKVDLKPGNNGGIAGVVWFESLSSHRQFKIGGGPLGSQELREAMMENPEVYVGRVYEVASFKEHEGRASHVIREHSDKGLL